MKETIERILEGYTWGCSDLEEGSQCANYIQNAGD